LELNPNSYMSALALGLLNVTVGTDYMPLPEDRRDLEQGKEWLKLASKIRPDASATPRFLGNIYRAEGDLEEALSLYQTAVQKNTEKTSQIMEQRLMVAHTLSAMGDYDSAREWYEKTIEVSLNDFWWAQNHVYYSYTWLAQKRYDEAVKFLTQAQIEIEKMNLSTFVLNNILNRVEFNRWLILAHSQRKEESQQSLSLFNNRATKNFEQSLANAIDSKEIESLKRNHSSGVIYRNAWSDIIFGEYESASRNLEILKDLQAPWIDKDPEALNGYYELSGYLNLNQGNIENALDNYEKRKEMGDLGEYHDYFYALCLKATGDQEKSDQIMVSLANNPFVDWNTSIVRNLAKAQVQS
jgi:tetratricopeptide (TPR) repeat protein